MSAVEKIINSLRPNFKEVCDNGKFQYWVDYEIELDEIQFTFSMGDDKELIQYLNARIAKLFVWAAEHDACVDVASTLEENLPDYKGKFKYD